MSDALELAGLAALVTFFGLVFGEAGAVGAAGVVLIFLGYSLEKPSQIEVDTYRAQLFIELEQARLDHDEDRQRQIVAELDRMAGKVVRPKVTQLRQRAAKIIHRKPKRELLEEAA